MTIIEALKRPDHCMLTYYNTWMYWDNTSEMWIVRRHRPFAEKTKVLITTDSEEKAVKMLLS